MKRPLTFSTTSEAIDWLEADTKLRITESELLDIAARYGIVLHAGSPLSAKAELMTIDFAGVADGSNPQGFKSQHSLGWRMLKLFPINIAQLLSIGETEAIHTTGNADNDSGEYAFLPEPVRITRELIRVSENAAYELSKRIKLLPKHTDTPAQEKEKPAERKERIKRYVNKAPSEGRSKESAFKELAIVEKCSVENIKRIYRDKDKYR